MENDTNDSFDLYIDNQSDDFKRRYSQILNSNMFPSAAFSPLNLENALQLDIGSIAKVAGRIISKRVMGQSTFLTIRSEGTDLQIFLNKKELGETVYSKLKKDIDVGDIFGFSGEIFDTKTNQRSLKVKDFTPLAKSLRPLPDKHKGLKDEDLRVRLRHIDLATNNQSREALLVRSKANQTIRDFLLDDGFIEVETPILQPIYGGANARPFLTELNAHGSSKVYLRISNELYLKRLIMGGLERVFEFAKDFRNEGIDKTHNPEFTQLELYQAYADYYVMMDKAENIFKKVASRFGETNYKFMGHNVNIEDWTRITMKDSIRQIGNINIDLDDREKVISYLRENNIPFKGELNYGNALLGLFEEKVEEQLIQPTIIYNYPVETTPLAKNHRTEPGMVERFEFFMGGKEFGNAYSELNDPLVQRKRFEDQQRMRENDDEVHPIDEDFLTAMEYGMPQTGGLGIGMDRLSMLFAQRDNIRDVLYFPFRR